MEGLILLDLRGGWSCSQQDHAGPSAPRRSAPVKGGRSCIEAEDIRVKRQRAGNGHTLLLGRREGMAGPLRKAHLRQQVSQVSAGSAWMAFLFA